MHQYENNININTNIETDINNDILINKTKYTYDFKNMLKNKIEKIKKKSHLIKIFMIIDSEKKGYVENNNGIFLYIHDLEDETYFKLNKYVSSITE